ncbi:GDSL-type esterase/lipase family protein [Dawidia soli]|uniref:G-D-S-L family lipolytic protein n=1 Tax=Dawidia soli TaxID=2782352 RepID=A0AAP2DCR3_9BACT|nr:GDSL-type esterase/lipase family protein [Dawidia soli]MBT1688420.1 G-D-S-L family lipolytic protein [Dawidia soli]
MRNLLLIACLLLLEFTVVAQDPRRFEAEVTNLVAGDTAVKKKNLILFTGSSSFRLWRPDLASSFPDKNVLNRGFGGSQMSDLIYYFDKLILPYHAKQIFIYEGDNDLASGKTPEEIIRQADSLLYLIRKKVSRRVNVVFLAAKPSLARWNQHETYRTFNGMLKAWAEKHKHVIYADIWTPMIDPATGKVKDDLFIEDGLHMKANGYEIWTRVLKPYMK